MDHPLTIIVSLAVALGIVTLVGHGIWVLLAALFRPSPLAGKLSAAMTNCRHCGARLIEDRCPVCNWPAPLTARDRTPLALAAARDQIDRFLHLGLIDRSVYQRLVDTLDAEWQRSLAAPLLAEVVRPEPVEPSTTRPLPAAPGI